jgi:hypothetical protein
MKLDINTIDEFWLCQTWRNKPEDAIKVLKKAFNVTCVLLWYITSKLSDKETIINTIEELCS